MGDRKVRLTWDWAESTALHSGNQNRMARGYPGTGVPKTLSPPGLDPRVRVWILQSPR